MTSITNETNDNSDQAAFWNGAMGHTWVAQMRFIENMLAPFRDVIVGRLSDSGSRAVLDVGCGNGAVAVELSRRLGSDASVVGIDISEPMIRNAQAQAARLQAQVKFIVGDSAAHDFEAQRFDSVISRFGCMFFADPASAFAHLRQFAADHAHLTLVAWRDAAINELFAAGIEAARRVLPHEPSAATGPGAFSFADRDVVATVLGSAGWRGVTLEPLDVGCAFPESGLRMFVEELAPSGVPTASLSDRDRAAVSRALYEAYLPFVSDGFVRFQARAWLIRAQAGVVSKPGLKSEVA